MSSRTLITDFQLANPLYRGASVNFYTVSGGAATTVLATLYAGTSGSATLANPQQLDSRGKQQQPIYVDEAVVAEIAGMGFAPHRTGVIASENLQVTSGTIGGVTSFGIRSSASAFDLELANDEVMTANRKLTLRLGNVARILTLSASLILAGTDGTTLTFPGTSATIARTDAAQAFTGLQTFNTGAAITAAASTKNMLQVGSGSTTLQGWIAGNLTSGYSGLWPTRVTPSGTNYAMAVDSGTTYINGSSNVSLLVANAGVVAVSGTGVAVTGTLASSGNFAINTSKFTVTAASGNTAIAGTLAVAGGTLSNIATTVGGTVSSLSNNSDNTSGASDAEFRVQSGGASGGDARITFVVTGATTFSIGIDNSDSDKLKISASGALGTTDYITISPGGVVTMVNGTQLVTVASAVGNSGFILPHGAAPTAPINGDLWTTTGGMFVRINGVTKSVNLT